MLPKELILFNNCNLKRKINFNLSKNSNLFFCESIIFGRTSMNEIFESGYFSDIWSIHREGKLIHTEAINTDLFNSKYLNNSSAFNNNYAVSTIFVLGDEFLDKVNSLSKTMTNNKNTTSDYSYWDSKLVIRLLSKDSYNLKFAINKIMSYFFDEKKIPKIWNI